MLPAGSWDLLLLMIMEMLVTLGEEFLIGVVLGCESVPAFFLSKI